MSDCNHKKASYVVDGDIKVICPICDDVDFQTVGDTTEIDES